MNSPLPWMGGKSRLAKQIIELIPDHDAYAEVFAGAAWVFFRKEESKFESINDVNSDLVAFYRVLQYHLEEFCKQFKWLLASREWFEDWNRQLAAGGLTDVQRAARFYYLQRQCFSADMVGRSFGRSTLKAPRINLIRMEEELSAVHLRMCSPNTFFYLDPPYFGFEEIYGKGVFAPEDFALIAERMAGVAGKFLLSINDMPPIREAFSTFNIREVQTTYCSRKASPTDVRELLISNY